MLSDSTQNELLAALRAILAEPYGCPACCSGKLIRPERDDAGKGHWDTCGFFLAGVAIAHAEMDAIDRKVERARGTVKWYSAEKGFGFIVKDGDWVDILVTREGIRADADGYQILKEGDLVEFDVVTAKNGDQSAVEVFRVYGEEEEAAALDTSWRDSQP